MVSESLIEVFPIMYKFVAIKTANLHSSLVSDLE